MIRFIFLVLIGFWAVLFGLIAGIPLYLLDRDTGIFVGLLVFVICFEQLFAGRARKKVP